MAMPSYHVQATSDKGLSPAQAAPRTYVEVPRPNSSRIVESVDMDQIDKALLLTVKDDERFGRRVAKDFTASRSH